MIRKILLIGSLLTILNSCNNKVNYPFNYVETKKEDDNEMLLYTCGEKPNFDTITMFCSEQKKDFNTGSMHIVVFFDNKSNAVFPNNPITALHNEESQLKHIKAVYTYNNVNSYSSLITYETNAWEGKSKETIVK